MDIIDEYEVLANTEHGVAIADDEYSEFTTNKCKPGNTSSRCAIMGGKRKTKTKKRNRRTKKKPKRRKTNR